MNKFKSYSRLLPRFLALLLVALAAGCGGGQDPILGTGATVIGSPICVPTASTAKAITGYSLAGAAGIINEPAKTIAVTVPSGTAVTALVATFTTTGTGVTVGGVVQISGTTANNFTAPVAYTVTAGDCTTVVYTVTVTVSVLPVASCLGAGDPLPLGTAASFGVLGGTALTITNPTSVTGDVGSPTITPAVGPSTLVGTLFDSSPASELVTIAAAVSDMQAGIVCALGRGCDVNHLAGVDFGGLVLAPGVHCVPGAMTVGSNLTLSTPGVYIFRATGALTTAPTVNVAFGGTANAANSSVYWVSTGAASNVSIGATNQFLGTIMVGNLGDPGAATLGANTTLLPGRVLSTNAVTLDTNTIAIP
jgi:hypothetical protein